MPSMNDRGKWMKEANVFCVFFIMIIILRYNRHPISILGLLIWLKIANLDEQKQIKLTTHFAMTITDGK